MSLPEFATSPVARPNRRASFSRPRPRTHCGSSSEDDIRDYPSRRLPDQLTIHSSMVSEYESSVYDAHWTAHHSDEMAVMPSFQDFDLKTFYEGTMFTLPEETSPSLRRKSSRSFGALKNGVSELRSLGRRMSASMRSKGNKPIHEVLAASNGASPLKAVDSKQLLEDAKPDLQAGIMSKPKWFRTPGLRRRPSLPALNSNPRYDPPTRRAPGPIPGSRRRPPILPDDLKSGAGARAAAAAAAQTEALQSLNLSSYDSLEPMQSRISELKIPSDSESGIGIDWRDSTETNIEVIRQDPAEVLATELLEQVFCYLDPVSLLQAERVSWDWNVKARSRAVWRHVFNREYNGRSHNSSSISHAPRIAMGLGKGTPDQDWRKMYLVRRAVDRRWTNGEAAAIYLNGHKDSVYCVQFDENKVITGSRDRTIRIWDAHTYQCIKKIGPPSSTRQSTGSALHPVTPQGVHPLYSINPPSADPCISDAHSDYHDASILCLQYDDEIMVTGSSDFTCIVWSIKEDYKPIRRLRGHAAGVLDVCIDQRYIVTCSKDTTIIVWDRHTGELLKRLVGHRGPVNAVQMRGNLVASASGDGMSKLWNLEKGVVVKDFSSKDRGLACIAFAEDGKTIYAGGNDQVIYEYDTNNGKVVRQLRGHKGLVRSLHLDSANKRLVSGSYDMSVKVWDGTPGRDSQEGGLLIDFKGWTTSWMLAAKSDFRKIVATSQDGRVLIIDFGYGLTGIDLLC